jgi:Tfp pilus assembly protein PilN
MRFGGVVTRNRQPFQFWLNVGTLLVVGIALLAVGIALIVSGILIAFRVINFR